MADRSAPPVASGSSGIQSADETENRAVRTAAVVTATGRRAGPDWTRAFDSENRSSSSARSRSGPVWLPPSSPVCATWLFGSGTIPVKTPKKKKTTV